MFRIHSITLHYAIVRRPTHSPLFSMFPFHSSITSYFLTFHTLWAKTCILLHLLMWASKCKPSDHSGLTCSAISCFFFAARSSAAAAAAASAASERVSASSLRSCAVSSCRWVRSRITPCASDALS